MIFQNEPIDFSSLPAVQDIVMHKPAPSYLKVVLLSNAFFMALLLVGVVVAYFVADEEPFPYFFVALDSLWVLIAIYSFWLAWRGYHNQAYALREKDILYKRGVIVQSLTTIPFNRVQHCEIKQGPIERFFGLKTLEIFTAGGSASDLEIPGLQGEQAQQLKDFILKNTALDGRSEEE